MSDFDATIAAVAAKQHSLITLADVKAAGGTKHHAATRCGGRWEWVDENVYRIAGVPWTYEARVLALILAAGEGACASHFCALRLHRLHHESAPPEISIPRSRGYRNSKALVRTSTDLDRCELTNVDGVPVTPVARTLLDSARFLRGEGLKSVVSKAIEDDLVTWHDLIEVVATHARRGRHGVRRLRNHVALYAKDDDITETDSELAALGLIREFELGEPLCQHKIFSDDGRRLIANMDFAYPALLLNLEVDGAVHLRPAVRLKDERRDAELRRLGWTVRRIWWEIPVRDPKLFVSIVRDTIREAEAKLLIP